MAKSSAVCSRTELDWSASGFRTAEKKGTLVDGRLNTRSLAYKSRLFNQSVINIKFQNFFLFSAHQESSFMPRHAEFSSIIMFFEEPRRAGLGRADSLEDGVRRLCEIWHGLAGK